MALHVADNVLRDDDGYLMSSSATFDSPGLAITSRSVELETDPAGFELARRWLGTVRIVARSQTPDDVFLGVAPSSDVDAWLDGVAHSTIVETTGGDNDPDTVFVDGDTPTLRPGDETFWVASASGEGSQDLSWEPEDGDWTVVVMNTEGTAPVVARASVGAEVPVLEDVANGLLVSGLVLLPLAALVLWLAVRRRTAAPVAPAAPGARDAS